MAAKSLREVRAGLGTTQGLLSKLPEAKIDVKSATGTSNHYYQVKPSSNFVSPGSKAATKW